MPTRGLSLVGFMDQAQAIAHLQRACVPVNPDPAVLAAEWVTAQANLGAAFPGAGIPAILSIPAAQAAYITALQTGPNWATVFANHPSVQGATFSLVEIEKLLAFQFTVDLDRSNHHAGSLTHPPTLDELLNMCLPQAYQHDEIMNFDLPQSLLIKSRSLNLQKVAHGAFAGGYLGIQIGFNLPFVHVVRHNGRCYLHNGFHRAYGAALAGATHIPCVFRDVPDHAAAGINPPGTFPASLLESTNPPTLSHFLHGRAHNVSLRSISRVLHISWSEYAIPDE